MSVIFKIHFQQVYVLFYLKYFLFNVSSYLSKSVFFTKVGIWFLLATFSCANLAEKSCADNNFFPISLIFWLNY